MLNLIQAEYYKLLKNKSFLSVVILALVPVVFAFVIFLDLDAMHIQKGAFNVLSFPNHIWQFTMGTTLPIIIFAYFSSAMGRELKDGSLIYQVTRVADRRKLVLAKILTLVTLNILYFIGFFVLALMSYFTFVSATKFSSQAVMDTDTMQLIFLSIYGLFLQMTFCLISLFLSFKLSTIGIVIFNFVTTSLLSFMSNYDGIGKFVPASNFYAPFLVDNKDFVLTFLLQFGFLCVVMLVSSLAIRRFFQRQVL